MRIADGKFDPALIVRVKQVDGDLVEVQLGGGNSASFHRELIRTVPDGSGSADSARNTPGSSTVDTQVTTATLPELGTLAMRMPLASIDSSPLNPRRHFDDEDTLRTSSANCTQQRRNSRRTCDGSWRAWMSRLRGFPVHRDARASRGCPGGSFEFRRAAFVRRSA
jgi:hypothetical protein